MHVTLAHQYKDDSHAHSHSGQSVLAANLFSKSVQGYQLIVASRNSQSLRSDQSSRYNQTSATLSRQVSHAFESKKLSQYKGKELSVSNIY